MPRPGSCPPPERLTAFHSAPINGNVAQVRSWHSWAEDLTGLKFGEPDSPRLADNAHERLGQ